MSESRVELKCSLYNVHHEIDMDRLTVEWIASKYQPGNRMSTDQSISCNGVLHQDVPKLIQKDKPRCMISTDFPFDDLKTSRFNISCHALMILENITLSNAATYTCRARIAFSPMTKKSKVDRNRRKIADPVNEHENDPYTLKYEMRTQLTIRVNRRNDYYVHKIVSSVIGIVVIIAVLLLVGKKVLGHKLGWETKPSNYAPTWPNAVPTACRRSASAGSLHSLHHSRSTLRRPSEPVVYEEEESDEDYIKSANHYRSNSDNYYSDNIEDMSEDNEGDEDSDKAEIKEFLRNVRSHGSFKLILGDSVVEPRRESKNPLERVANT